MMTEDRELWAEEVERYAVHSMTCDDSRARNRELVSTRRRHASTYSLLRQHTYDYILYYSAGAKQAPNRTSLWAQPDGISVELLKSLSWRP
eukprot:3873060-Pyramimonas_sp.AAC.1